MNKNRSILFIWELGTNMGHISRVILISNELIRRGHIVNIIIKEIDKLKYLSIDENIGIYRTPRIQRKKKDKQYCFSDILFNIGFYCPNILRSRLLKWINIISKLKPDIICFDHAPTALLACRNMDIIKIIINNGYLALAPNYPNIDLVPWKEKNNNHIKV